MRGIPKFVQSFEKDIPEDDLRTHLIKSFELGGVDIDEEMIKNNPNAKKLVPYISITPKLISVTKAGIHDSESRGDWVYCGNLYYVRKIDDNYEFAKYFAYDTDERKIIGEWVQEKYIEGN